MLNNRMLLYLHTVARGMVITHSQPICPHNLHQSPSLSSVFWGALDNFYKNDSN